jgi:transposase-like protein
MGKPVFLWENTMSKQKRTRRRRRRRFTAEFKAETVKLLKQSDRTMADIAMELGISEYIEVFYNRIRRHSTIGNISPAKFEEMELAKAA